MWGLLAPSPRQGLRPWTRRGPLEVTTVPPQHPLAPMSPGQSRSQPLVRTPSSGGAWPSHGHSISTCTPNPSRSPVATPSSVSDPNRRGLMIADPLASTPSPGIAWGSHGHSETRCIPNPSQTTMVNPFLNPGGSLQASAYAHSETPCNPSLVTLIPQLRNPPSLYTRCAPTRTPSSSSSPNPL